MRGGEVRCARVKFTYVRRQDVRCKVSPGSRCLSPCEETAVVGAGRGAGWGGGGADSRESGGTWQMDVLFHMCK